MNLFRPTLLAVLLAALCAGCVNVDEQTAATPREYWQPVKNAVPEEPLSLPAPLPGADGAQVAAKNELALAELVDIALANNPQTRQAWYGAKSAAARLGETNSTYYPQVTVGAEIERSKVRNVGFNGQSFGAGTTYSTFYGPSIEITYLLWNFGKDYAATEAARQTLYAANYLYNQQIQDVILATQLAYFNYNAAQGFVDAAQATLNDANTSYKAANARLNAGLGTTQDERQAFAQVKNAEYQLDLAQAQVETSRAQLALSLGIPVSDQLRIARDQTIPNLTDLDKNVSDLMAAAMRQRPDLMAAYANLQAAQQSLAAARDDRWPTVSAFFNGTYGEYSAGTTTGNPYNLYTGGLQVSWDIFSGFEKTYAIIDADEQVRATRESLRTQELKDITDVWNFYYAFKSAVNQVGSTSAEVEAQQKAYDAINKGYGADLNNYIDLTTALSNLATARQQKVQADANLGTAIANLAHATGSLPLKAPANPADNPSVNPPSPKTP
jgi:outer membrane protein TolC